MSALREYTCRTCSKTFLSRETGRVYCGRACMGQGKVRGEHRPCPTCGVPVWVVPHRLRGRSVVYCSYSCHRKTRTLENATRWKGGSRQVYRRHMVRLFGDVCMVCGWAAAETDLHHIVPRAKGGRDTFDNIILLCPNDHRLADRGKLKRHVLRAARRAARRVS